MYLRYRWGNLIAIIGFLSFLFSGIAALGAETGPVTLWHLPQGPIQPQAAVDSKGVVPSSLI